MFSHIGLTGMVIAYAVAGGFIFKHLEQTNEKQECIRAEDLYNPAENETAYKMWDVARNLGQDDDTIDLALLEYTKLLRKFRTTVLELGYDGKNCSIMGEPNGPGYQWSFAGALLFSVTVITTIGEYLTGKYLTQIICWTLCWRLDMCNVCLRSTRYTC